MSSWLGRLAGRKAAADEPPPPKSFYTMVTEDDPATQYLDLLYCYLYAQGQGGELRVYDQSNPAAPFEGFFTSAFKDLPGLRYIDTRDLRSKMLHQKPGTYMPYIRGLGVERLREGAEQFFQLKTSKLAEVEAAVAGLTVLTFSKEGKGLPQIPVGATPAVYDCAAVIVGAGAVKSVATFVGAIRTLQGKMRAAYMNVFVLADDEAVFKELARLGDGSWTFYTVPLREAPVTRSQKALTRVRLENYTQFLAEIATVQNTPNILCPLGSAVGKFIYLTCMEPANFRAVDGAKFDA
jgi:hypothetical protein